MGKPLSPDHVFDFPMNEPHPAYDFFAPAPLPEYADNLNNNNGWLAADDYLLGELAAMVNEQMVVPAVEEMDVPIDGNGGGLAGWFVMMTLRMIAQSGFGEEEVFFRSVYEVGGPSIAVAEGPYFPHVAPGLPVAPSVIKDLKIAAVLHCDVIVWSSPGCRGGNAGVGRPIVIQAVALEVEAGPLQSRCAAERHADLAAADHSHRDEQP
ncbi:hypothetical protein Tco_1533570 [Tanacetum coccineum]